MRRHAVPPPVTHAWWKLKKKCRWRWRRECVTPPPRNNLVSGLTDTLLSEMLAERSMGVSGDRLWKACYWGGEMQPAFTGHVRVSDADRWREEQEVLIHYWAKSQLQMHRRLLLTEKLEGRGSREDRGEEKAWVRGAEHAANTWMSYTGLEEGMAANCR